MPPFWLSIGVLSITQGLLVVAPGAVRGQWFEQLRGRRWALIPPASIIGFVLVAAVAEQASADTLTYLALIAVPLLAAVALGLLAHHARRPLAALAPVLFAIAWADRGGLAGETAALLLSAFSCVALGVLLAAVAPPRWLGVGVVAMALADSGFVIADLLQKPNDALNAAHPAAGLPRLQSAVWGSAVMGYGDLFIAAVLGALLAASVGRRVQLRAGLLTAALAIAFDLMFFIVDELPATVPVAAALVLLALSRRRSGATREARELRHPARAPARPEAVP
jgi:hypothetical protein